MKKLSIILFLFLSQYVILAQETTSVVDDNSKYAIAFTPQYLIMGGMRVDVDFKLSPKTCITIAPTFYFVDDAYMFPPEYTSYIGVGANLNYRYFPSGKGIYTAAGLTYKHLDCDYSEFGDESDDAIFNTYGFDITFGYQFNVVEQLFMDIYFGWGFRYSTQESVKPTEYWSEAFLSLAYSGYLPVAGLRVGFEF